MSLRPNVEEQEVLAATQRLSYARLTPHDWLVETALALAFIGAVVGVWTIEPSEPFRVVPVLLCFITLIAATYVRFETPFGYTVVTQLAFVPLLFTAPLGIVPLVVVAALAAMRVPEILFRRYPAGRLVKEIVNSWFAIGPVAVFAVAGVGPEKAGPLVLGIALLAQFAVDFAISSLRFWAEREATLTAQLMDAWIYGFDAALSGIALVVGEEIHRNALAALTPLPLLALLAVFAQERNGRMRGLTELNRAYKGTALVLGEFVEADDGYTGAHCRDVVRLALHVADQLSLNAERRRNLEFGALLHDVGKIAIPKEIINKPGRLDEREWEIMKTHTIEGQRILDQIGGFMHSVGLIVRAHHERWDGNGYPDRLAGENIPLEARIIACCDSWNAMRTDRSYRRALPYEVARAELVTHCGGQFDPQIVEAMLQIVDAEADGEAVTADELATAAQALVQPAHI